MNTRTLLLAVCITLCTGRLPAANAEAAAAQPDTSKPELKTAILDGYLQRCVEVLHSKSYSREDIKAECTCELDYIDQHFAVFTQMLEGSTADNQQQINHFKKQLLQCKVKPQAGSAMQHQP